MPKTPVTSDIIMAGKLNQKQWKLTEHETFSSYSQWKHNLLTLLETDGNFAPFLAAGATWAKKTVRNPLRGFVDDEEGLTAAEKVANLHRMLGVISQWVPVFLCTDIVDNSTSLDAVWRSVRKYYGFQQSETQFIKFSQIVWEDGERPERLFQRILAHLQDNLLRSDSSLRHDGELPTYNEEMSPSLERMAVLRWLELIHPSLLSLVMRTFAYDLQRMTLKDLQPQICDALDGFLEELRQDDIKASRVYTPAAERPRYASSFNTPRQQPSSSRQRSPAPRVRFASGPKSSTSRTQPQARTNTLYCRVCRAEGRPYSGHDLFGCDYISNAEKRSMVSVKQVEVDNDCADDVVSSDMAALDVEQPE